MSRGWRAILLGWIGLAMLSGPSTAAAEPGADTGSSGVRIELVSTITLRDGVQLGGVLYRSKAQTAPGPCVVTLTPYTADTYHDRGMYFAAQGLTFLIADVRGRGRSQGEFRPNIQEVNDGYDVVEWLAQQPYCNGKVAMWGGSYAGFNQWATAKNRPPHLATIVPAAASYMGVDFPWRNNIGNQYVMQWLTFVSGRALQSKLFYDRQYWAGLWRERFIKGEPFANLPQALGGDDPHLREWLDHPMQDAFWDAYVPTPDDYRAMDLPVLTITGAYDDDQPGALSYHRNAQRHGSAAWRAKQYLIIGPWDHAGTRTPEAHVGGVLFGPASLVDLAGLHTEWYRWTMSGGPKPAFLQKPVAYFVMGADVWKYAESLDAITAQSVPYCLQSDEPALSLARPGQLSRSAPKRVGFAQYIYDPRDTSRADLEAGIDVSDPAETRMVVANDGHQLVYETEPFAQATEISGMFKLDAWIAIDQPDTDFQATVYEVTSDGKRILLTSDIKRARYRTSLRSEALITSRKPLRYVFDSFTFTSRQIAPGSRLSLIVGPINSIYTQKNYNSGRPVSQETMADARTVTVQVHGGGKRNSLLYVPFAEPGPERTDATCHSSAAR